MKRFLLLLLLIPTLALAAYPERPITMLIAYPPGGGTDLVGRAIVPFIEKHLGAILHCLQGGDRFLGSVNVAEANGVKLEDGGEEGHHEDQADEHFRESGATNMEVRKLLHAMSRYDNYKNEQVMCLFSRS